MSALVENILKNLDFIPKYFNNYIVINPINLNISFPIYYLRYIKILERSN